MSLLTDNDLRYVVQRLPRDIRELLSDNSRRVMVGGGFIRAIIAGEEPSDIDIFGDSKERLEILAEDLVKARPGSKIHKTGNAITVLTPDRLPVQFITRWTFDYPSACCQSFDFTVCQAVIWRTGSSARDRWESEVGSEFYIDLAGRRLVYTNPVREEEAGGSMLRVLKYVKRGYSIQPCSLGDVIARMASKVEPNPPIPLGRVFQAMLREVDPLLVVDGFDVVDDHEHLEGVQA